MNYIQSKIEFELFKQDHIKEEVLFESNDKMFQVFYSQNTLFQNRFSKKDIERVRKFFNRDNIYKQLKTMVSFLIPHRSDVKLILNIGGGSYTDGNSITVGLPDLFIGRSYAEIFTALRALIGHESQHVNSSDFRAFKKYQEEVVEYFANKYPALNSYIARKYVGKIAHHFGNSTEDGRIEKITPQKFPGYAKYYKFLNMSIWEVQSIQGNSELEDFLYSVTSFSVTGLNPKDFKKFYSGTELESNLNKIKPMILDSIEARTCQECLNQTVDIMKAVEPYLAKLLTDRTQEAEEFLNNMDTTPEFTTSEEQEHNNNPSDVQTHFVPKKSESKKQEEKDEDEKKKQQSGQGEEEQEEKDKKSSSNEKDEQEQQSGGSGTDSDEEEEQESKDENGSGKGSSDEDENEEDQDGKGGSSDDSSDEEEADESNESSNGSGNDDSDEENNSDSENGEGDGEDSDTKEEDQNGEDGETGENNDSSKDSSDDKDSSKGDSSENSSSNDSQASDQEEEGDDEEKQADNNPQGMDDKEEDEIDEDEISSFIEELKREMEEEASEKIEQRKDTSKKQKLKEEDFRLNEEELQDLENQYKNDVNKHFEEVRDLQLQHQLPADIKREGSRFRKEVERLFRNKEAYTLTGQRKGMLDMNNLYKIQTKDFNVFMKKGVPIKSDFVAYLLEDGSGSMSDRAKFDSSKRALAIMEEGLKGIIPFKITTFNTDWGGNSVIHQVIKDFNEENRSYNYAYNAFKQRRPSGGNKDGYSIRVATKELLKRPEKDRILIIFSDGLPSNYRDGKQAGMVDVKNAIKEARKAGIYVVSLLMGTTDFRDMNIENYRYMYEKNIISCEPNMITNQLTRMLKKIISR